MPDASALVTVEVQGGVVGAQSPLRDLAEAAAPAVENIARLCRAARSAGVPVVHCVAHRRADGVGSNGNARLFGAMRKAGVAIEPGTPGGDVVPALGPEPGDLVLARLHGVGPMGDTGLDAVLRNLGVTTIVATGVSVNVAVTSLVLDAVNRGYRVVVPRDAVAGVPPSYADAVIDGTLAVLAEITTTDELEAVWLGRR